MTEITSYMLLLRDAMRKNKPNVKHNSPRQKLSFSDFRVMIICLLLTISVLVVFAQVKDFSFIRLDDQKYVVENPLLRLGFTFEGMVETFTKPYFSIWHPLTVLSLMFDYQVFGLNPAGSHLVNLFVHLVNTLLLFFILRRITGVNWRSAFVAALFALHPLHVESVAWVSERKDVLSGLFWMLTMGSYALYTEHPGIRRYLWVIAFFILGMLSKPMLVTLPFVLLLLDYWPLSRLNSDWHNIKKLIIEKIPLFAVSASLSIITFLSAQKEAMQPIETFTMYKRLANALQSYVLYIWKMIWPHNLVVFYPYPETISSLYTAGALLLLVAITFSVCWYARKYPYLIVGWFWYLGTLIPVIGLVQVGSYSMADRYSYLPLIGLFIMITWFACDLVNEQKNIYKSALKMVSVLVILACIIVSSIQTAYWRDDFALFGHALEKTSNNIMAHNSLGAAYLHEGKLNEGIYHLTQAVEINPYHAEALNNLGGALLSQGKYAEAVPYLTRSVEIKPNVAGTHNNLGIAFRHLNKTGEAIDQYKAAIALDPRYAEAYNNLGVIYLDTGKLRQAYDHFRHALAIKNDYPAAKHNLELAIGLDQSLLQH